MTHRLLTGPRRSRVEWLVAGILLMLLGVVLAVALHRERSHVEAEESDRLQVQARVIDENLTRQLEGVNNALAGVRDELEQSKSVAAWPAASARLKLLSDAIPGVRTMAILDARGAIVASSRAELLGINSSQRELFAAPYERPDPGLLYVSAPFRSPLGPLVIGVGRVLTGSRSELAGVVVATLDPEYFQVVLRSVLYAPDMRTSIAHGDGRVFVNMPVNERALGVSLAKPGSLFTRHQQSGRTATLMTGRVMATGDDRMIAIRTLERPGLKMDKPMVIAVSRELAAIYLPWYGKVLRFGFFYAVVALGSGLGLYVSQRRRQVLDRLEAEAAEERRQAAERLADSEEQLRQVTDSLPALVSRWDIEQRFRFVNRAYGDWLGVEPASLLGRSLREVYGEQAYGTFRHHVDAALGGARVVYEREMATPRGPRHVEVTLVPQRASDGTIKGAYALINDLTVRHEAELQRARSEERLSLALEGSGLALFDWDIGADRIYQSAQASAMRGDPPAEETASPACFGAFVHPDDLDAMRSSMKAALRGEVPVYHAEFRIRRDTGEWLWVRARGRVVERDDRGRALRLAGTYADINARKVVEQRLRRQAEFDTLTDLPNRALFRERLQQGLRRATRGSTLALLFLDVDHFKTINDTFGHEAGDQLLKVFATRMRDCVRHSDTVARLAGDEFTVVLEGLGGADDARAIAGKLVETLREPVALAGSFVEITISIGIAMARDGQTDDAQLLRRADAALYEAKRRGRNGFFCDEADASVAPRAAVGESSTAVGHPFPSPEASRTAG